MKFRLAEHMLSEEKLNEKYNVMHDGILQAQKELKRLLAIGNTRGNGVLCEFIISAYNKIYGTSLNKDDYLIHHIDLNHNNNSWDNILLINTKMATNILTHIGFHNNIMNSILCQLAADNHIALTNPIDAATAKHLINLDTNKFINYCINIGMLKANRQIPKRALSTDLIEAALIIK